MAYMATRDRLSRIEILGRIVASQPVACRELGELYGDGKGVAQD
jgi:hypothetical protein